jgi:hypothetical protein
VSVRPFVTAFVLLFSVSWSLHAQSTGTGTITGHVTDASGASIAHAEVTATSISSGATYSEESDSQGIFHFAGVRAGEYKIETTASGFRKLTQQSVVLAADTTRIVDLQLTVGSMSDAVTVTDAHRQSIPPMAPLVRSSTESSSKNLA